MFIKHFATKIGCLMLGMLLLGSLQVFAAPGHGTYLTSSHHANTAINQNVGTIVIFVSGSTNHPCAQTMVLSSNSYLTLMNCQTVKLIKIVPAFTTAMFQDIVTSGPLNILPPKSCWKSASFGTTTVVEFNAHSSPDVSCSEDRLGLVLYHDTLEMQKEIGNAQIISQE